jgi:hypothetical protein
MTLKSGSGLSNFKDEKSIPLDDGVHVGKGERPSIWGKHPSF